MDRRDKEPVLVFPADIDDRSWKHRHATTLTIQTEGDDDFEVTPRVMAALEALLRDQRFRSGAGDSGHEWVFEIGGHQVFIREQWENQYWEGGVKLPHDPSWP